MRLYVEPMDATVTDVDPDGRVYIEDEGWARPSLQERRAIIYAARAAVDWLTELVDRLEQESSPARDAGD